MYLIGGEPEGRLVLLAKLLPSVATGRREAGRMEHVRRMNLSGRPRAGLGGPCRNHLNYPGASCDGIDLNRRASWWAGRRRWASWWAGRRRRRGNNHCLEEKCSGSAASASSASGEVKCIVDDVPGAALACSYAGVSGHAARAATSSSPWVIPALVPVASGPVARAATSSSPWVIPAFAKAQSVKAAG